MKMHVQRPGHAFTLCGLHLLHDRDGNITAISAITGNAIQLVTAAECDCNTCKRIIETTDWRGDSDAPIVTVGLLSFEQLPLTITAHLDQEANGGRHSIRLGQTMRGPVVEAEEDHGRGVHRKRFALSTLVHVLLNMSEEELWSIESRHRAAEEAP